MSLVVNITLTTGHGFAWQFAKADRGANGRKAIIRDSAFVVKPFGAKASHLLQRLSQFALCRFQLAERGFDASVGREQVGLIRLAVGRLQSVGASRQSRHRGALQSSVVHADSLKETSDAR